MFYGELLEKTTRRYQALVKALLTVSCNEWRRAKILPIPRISYREHTAGCQSLIRVPQIEFLGPSRTFLSSELLRR